MSLFRRRGRAGGAERETVSGAAAADEGKGDSGEEVGSNLGRGSQDSIASDHRIILFVASCTRRLCMPGHLPTHAYKLCTYIAGTGPRPRCHYTFSPLRNTFLTLPLPFIMNRLTPSGCCRKTPAKISNIFPGDQFWCSGPANLHSIGTLRDKSCLQNLGWWNSRRSIR